MEMYTVKRTDGIVAAWSVMCKRDDCTREVAVVYRATAGRMWWRIRFARKPPLPFCNDMKLPTQKAIRECLFTYLKATDYGTRDADLVGLCARA